MAAGYGTKSCLEEKSKLFLQSYLFIDMGHIHLLGCSHNRYPSTQVFGFS